MKTKYHLILGALALAAAALAGCGGSPKDAGAAAPSGRAIAITANDTMKYSLTEIRAKPGEALAVTLTNTGAVPKAVMGHNWILLVPETDLNAFSAASAQAAATGFIPDSFKGNIIVSTRLLGPNESDTVSFNAPAKPGRYPFVCAFPGHMQAGMKGFLIVE